ncbi:translesion DNA synthesis-associated protein ImuA [Alcaligenaceae bacterium CGII-47]|nr:translesion DNA synthesis-associated protein ImuA [Alcaligenaceae bacterium CGII-47]
MTKEPLPSLEQIHPALWRASQLSRGTGHFASTGYPAVDAQLPGGGWPLGQLIDLLIPRSGIGEIQMLRTAFANGDTRPIAMVQPPYRPMACAWAHGDNQASRLIWIRAPHRADALWAAEHILKSGTFAGLLLWQDTMRAATARRLHLAAQAGDTLCVLFRPLGAAQQASPAPLRILLRPSAQGLSLLILKRRGQPSTHLIPITLYPSTRFVEPHHASMDRRAPSVPQSGHALPQLAY